MQGSDLVMKILNYISSFVKNKFLLAGIGFIVWMFFFDKNDVFTQYERYSELKELKQSANYYSGQITNCRQEIKDLRFNTYYLEKLAREKYYFRRENEDIYIIYNK